MNYISVFMGIAAGLLFGAATPLSKMSLSHMNSFQLAGLLYIGSSLVFFPHIIRNGRKSIALLRNTGKWKQLIGVVLFGGVLGPLMLMLGLETADSMSVSIWLNLELVATAVIGVLFFRDYLDRHAVIGVILTLSAGVLASCRSGASGLLSGLFVLLACIAWGIDNHLTSIIDGVSPQVTTFIKGLVGGGVNLLIGMHLGGWRIAAGYVGTALLIGVFSYGLSIYLYVTSSQSLGATRSQILFSTAPFWGILGAALFLGESIDMITAFAAITLLAGIGFSCVSSHGHRHSHPRTAHIHMHTHLDGHHGHRHGEDVPGNVRHSHYHEHEETEHTHEHYPDIHHRHTHK